MIEGRGAWSTSRGGPRDVLLDRAVMVPVAMVELDEPHAALGQPAGQQAVGARTSRRLPSVPYSVEDVPGLVRQVDQLGHAGLHPEGGLVGGDPGGDLGVVDHLVLERIEPLDGVDDVALPVGGGAPRDVPM